jgi:hypothetical protein
MEYSVNLRKLSAAFYEWFDVLCRHSGECKVDKDFAHYLFYRLTNENSSFMEIVCAFNRYEKSYIMQKDETTAFLLALTEILGMQEIDDLDGNDDVFELENWRRSK